MSQEETGSLRVKVRREYLPFYKDLLKRKIFKEHNEFFTFCSCVGKSAPLEGQQPPLIELCQAYTFKEDQRTVLKTLVYNRKHEVVSINEMFASAEILADNGFTKLLNSTLQDLVFVNSDGEVSLNPGKERELQVALSKYVSQKMVEVPF